MAEEEKVSMDCEAGPGQAIAVIQDRGLKLIPSHRLQLKIAVGLNAADRVAALSKLVDALGLTGWSVEPIGMEHLIDDYWDTSHFSLLGRDEAFRIRRSSEGFFVNYKGPHICANRSFISNRNEVPIKLSAEEVLDGSFSGFLKERRILAQDLVDARFRFVLRVSNARRLFQIKRDNVTLKLVLDQFIYSSPSSIRTSPVQSEIEIHASDDIAANWIVILGKELAEKGLKPSQSSKYARGVSLLHLTAPRWLLKLVGILETPVFKCIAYILAALGALAGIGRLIIAFG